MGLVVRLIALMASCNVFSWFVALLYVTLAMPPETVGAQTFADLWRWFLISSLASFSLTGGAHALFLLPLSRVVQKKGPLVDVPVHLQRRAIHLPVSSARISTWGWIAGAATLPLYVLLTQAEIPLLVVMHVLVGSIVVSGVAGVLIFYVVEWDMRTHVLPRLFPDGKLSAVPGAKPVTASFKMLVMLFTSVAVPVGVLMFAAYSGEARAQVVAYLGVVFFLSGCMQVLLISRSINRPAQELAVLMERVTRNDLSVQAPVTSLDAIGQLAEGFNAMVAGLRRAEFVKDTFGKYVTRQVMDEILGGNVALGGELRTVTVLFSDIRGFTALSEKLPPEDVVRFLNRYLDIMVDVVVEHGGTVDKFIGDAVMASFGVPLSQGDDAQRAVRAALSMLTRLDAWNQTRRAAGEEPIEIGIGLHTGVVVAGNIGSQKKMEYTVIGDTVNTSSRIEQLNKHLGTRLLVSEQTYAQVKHLVQGRALAPVDVKGKSLPLQVYEISGLA